MTLFVTFYDASLNIEDLSGNNHTKLIGVCQIPLLENGNKFLVDGEHLYPIVCTGHHSDTPSLSISTQLNSSLISTDIYLNLFYDSVDSKVLDKCDEKEVIINLFSIIDKIVNDFLSKKKECIESLLVLTKKITKIDGSIFENCLNDYAIHFAFRNDNSLAPEFHRSLFSLAELLKRDSNLRKSIDPLSSFFFNLAIKSIYLTKERLYALNAHFCTEKIEIFKGNNEF